MKETIYPTMTYEEIVNFTENPLFDYGTHQIRPITKNNFRLTSIRFLHKKAGINEFNPSDLITDCYCWLCGERYKLSQNLIWNPKTKTMYFGDCIGYEVKEECDIHITENTLLFKNFFRNEVIKENKTNSSIESVVGRRNLMQKYASLGIGYMQLGNCSVAIAINKNQDEILFYNETEESETNAPDGYDFYGEISLEMWRLMFKQTKAKPHKPSKDWLYKENIKVPIKQGVYHLINHYRDGGLIENTFEIFGKMKLKV